MRRRLYTRYAGAPLDEYALLAEARTKLQAMPPLTGDALMAFYRQHGGDLAAALAYLHLTESPARAAGWQHLSTLPDRLPDQPVTARLLIVPGFFWQEHPELGGDGAVISAVASRCGIDCQIIPTESRARVTTNLPIINDALHEAAAMGGPVWLLSISKGTAELRAALAGLPADSAVWQALAGWVNFSGVYSGTPLADYRTTAPWPRAWYQSIFTLFGVDFGLIDDLRSDNPLWAAPCPWPADKPLLHVLGLPLASHVQPPLVRRWRWLLDRHGPNDGITPLAHALDWPGQIYPLWGADHMMRSPALTGLAYRLTRLIAETTSD